MVRAAPALCPAAAARPCVPVYCRHLTALAPCSPAPLPQVFIYLVAGLLYKTRCAGAPARGGLQGAGERAGQRLRPRRPPASPPRHPPPARAGRRVALVGLLAIASVLLMDTGERRWQARAGAAGAARDLVLGGPPRTRRVPHLPPPPSRSQHLPHVQLYSRTDRWVQRQRLSSWLGRRCAGLLPCPRPGRRRAPCAGTMAARTKTTVAGAAVSAAADMLLVLAVRAAGPPGWPAVLCLCRPQHLSAPGLALSPSAPTPHTHMHTPTHPALAAGLVC